MFVFGRKNTSNSGRFRMLRIFTLLEMLVVVTIFMILAALLMPSLSSALAEARAASCSNNLRGIYFATTMYTDDYNGWLPGTTWNAQHFTYLSSYLQLTFDITPTARTANYLGCYSLGPANFKPGGNSAYCPALYSSADQSPAWSGGSVGVYYYPNYMHTLRTPYTTASTSGCWLNNIAIGTFPSRRLRQLRNDSVIMGEANYWASSPYNSVGRANQAGTLFNSSANSITGGSAPAWNLHVETSNFLFSDGHMKRYPIGKNFQTTEYIPIK